MNNTVLEQLVEEVNDAFFKKVVAQEQNGYLYLTDKRVDRYETDLEVVTDSLVDVVDFIEQEFNVDLNIVGANYRTVAFKVYNY